MLVSRRGVFTPTSRGGPWGAVWFLIDFQVFMNLEASLVSDSDLDRTQLEIFTMNAPECKKHSYKGGFVSL